MYLRIKPLFFIFLGGVLGFSYSQYISNNKFSNFLEDIIAEEIILLEQLKKFNISCVSSESSQNLHVKKINDVIFVWEIIENNKTINKMAIGKNLVAVSEIEDNKCIY